jgi:hypothetical protein
VPCAHCTASPSSSWPWDQTINTSRSIPDISTALDTLKNTLHTTPLGTTAGILTPAKYTPSNNTVLPTHIPTNPKPSITAAAPTDIGTGVEAILAGATLTPSLRQMIRNDISGTVKKEFHDVNSRYQIQYNYE